MGRIEEGEESKEPQVEGEASGVVQQEEAPEVLAPPTSVPAITE